LNLKSDFNFRSMIICICRNVCERKVRAAIDDGATTVDAIGKACRAGTGCGACRQQICAIIAETEKTCPCSLADCSHLSLAVLSPAA